MFEVWNAIRKGFSEQCPILGKIMQLPIMYQLKLNNNPKQAPKVSAQWSQCSKTKLCNTIKKQLLTISTVLHLTNSYCKLSLLLVFLY